MLPSLFRVLEREFGLHPKALATLVLCQSLGGAVTAPVWAHFSDGSRARIGLLAFASGLLATWTMLTAAVSAYWQLLVLKILTGIALAAITPISQSIVADIVPAAGRGTQFGLIGFWTSVGSMATAYGEERIGTMTAWRVILLVACAASCGSDPPRLAAAAPDAALLLTRWGHVCRHSGALTLLLAVIIPLVASDPRADEPAPKAAVAVAGGGGRLRSVLDSLEAARLKARDAFRLPTFQLILLQGAFGVIPWRCAEREATASNPCSNPAHRQAPVLGGLPSCAAHACGAAR
jgi:MFS family permease